MSVSIKTPYIHALRLNEAGIYIFRMTFIISTLLIKLAIFFEIIDTTQGFAVNTLTLLAYLIVESLNLWSFSRRFFFINPVILASWLSTIALPYCISNIIYFLPEDYFYGIPQLPEITTWMNQLMFLVMMGSCAMWAGFSSGFVGRRILLKLQRKQKLSKWLTQSGYVNLTSAYYMVAICIITRIFMIKIGLYGYVSGDANTEANVTQTTANYSMYLGILSNLYFYVLLALGLQVFSSVKPSSLLVRQFWILLLIELFFGLLSGSKGGIIFTLILLGQIYYCQRNRFPIFLIPILFAGLFVAYAVIEPYRSTMIEKKIRAESLTEIVTVMFNPDYGFKNDDEHKPSTIIQGLYRTNMTSAAAYGIEYATVNEDLPPNSPDFLGNIFMAPIYAVVPRFLLSTKPVGNLGLWYTQDVMGYKFYSFTAMGPFTYLNFAGGVVAVVLGFFFIGILQRILFDVFTNINTGGFFIYFCFLNAVTNINSAIDGAIIGAIRDIPIVLIIRYFLLKQKRP